MTRAWGLAGVLALGCGDTPAPTPTKVAEATPSGAPAPEDAPVSAQPNVSVDRGMDPKIDLCRAYDLAAVATALGWEGLTKVRGSGGMMRGARHRSCGYVGKGRIEDQRFGASFSMAKDFDMRHQGLQVAYEPRAAIAGHDARVARTETSVVLQVMTPTMRVTVDVEETGRSAAELEPVLEGAAIALIGSIPADGRDLLDPNWREDETAAAERQAKREAKREAKAAKAGGPAKAP